MKLDQLDTPSLLIDRERLLKNLADMQRYADSYGVQLRPHTKTHKMPAIAKLQLQQGACGVAAAKTGEAESWRKMACRMSLSPMRSSASRSCGASPRWPRAA